MGRWVDGNLKISQRALDVVERAAKAAYERDEEACGYLRGPSADVALCDEAVELENLANKYHEIDPEGHPRTGREYFKINSLKFEKAINAGNAEERPVKVFFHSHLDCGAYFSEEDAASMTNGGTGDPAYDLAYLVTSIRKGEIEEHKLFIWDRGQGSFVESPYETIA